MKVSGFIGLMAAAGLSLGASAQEPKPTAPAATPAQPAAPVPVPAPLPAAEPQAEVPKPEAVDFLRKEAGSLMPLVETEAAKRFLFSTTWLPVLNQPRDLYLDRATRRALTKAQYDALPEAERAPFKVKTYDGYGFYYTSYGTPLAFARPLDLVCRVIGGAAPLTKKKILDFGYGTIGHLRLMASMGNDVTGVDVDPVLKALYSEADDVGVVPGVGLSDISPEGKLALVHGHFPGDADVTHAVGTSYDVVFSKNTLKNGYINPEHEVDKRMLVDLGVPQEEFVAKVAELLKPGGLFMIYNICPAQKPDPKNYIPWADGRCPFSQEVLEKAGFNVVEYNKDDSEIVRQMAKALEWDQGEHPMDLEKDLFATYTLLRKGDAKPASPAPGADKMGTPRGQ